MGKSANSLADLRPDPRNARRHTPRNVGSIVDALHKVGAARSIVIDEDNTILAGNATVEAAGEAGIEKVQVVEADGETIIAVRRTGLTKKQKAQLAILDNRAAELAEWDLPNLTATIEEFGFEPKTDLAFLDYELNGLTDAESKVNPEAEWEGMPEFKQEDLTAEQSIHVHFKTREDVEAFAKLVGQKITDKTRAIWFPPAEIGRYADKSYVDESKVSGLHSD